MAGGGGLTHPLFQFSGREGALFPLDLGGIRAAVEGREEREEGLPVAGQGHLQISGTREFDSLFGNLSTGRGEGKGNTQKGKGN